tara:strand:+ start:2915 stop:3193 length:279 start_codon:yes stop_codon:yes gene_type:complete
LFCFARFALLWGYLPYFKNIYLQETLLQIFNHHLRLWFYISSKTGIWHQVVRLHNSMTIGVVETIQGGFSDKAEEMMIPHITLHHKEARALL